MCLSVSKYSLDLHLNQDSCIAGGSKSSQPIPESYNPCSMILALIVEGTNHLSVKGLAIWDWGYEPSERQRFSYMRWELFLSCCQFLAEMRPSNENDLGEHSTLFQESLCTHPVRGCDVWLSVSMFWFYTTHNFRITAIPFAKVKTTFVEMFQELLMLMLMYV